MTSRIVERATVDTRALAAVRIALGVALLADLLHRAGSMTYFYTDAGVYPVAAYEATYSQYDVSLHALSGDLWFQQMLFVIAGIFAVLFVLGYRTRLVGFVSLLFLFSLQARNPAVLNGGDRLFRVFLLVALVTPLGERWSIDALRRGSARQRVATFGTAALLVQPVVVFVSNAILKHQGESWYAGDALEIAMANDVMTVLLGNVIAEYPTLLTALNYAWILLLAGSPLLLLTAGRLRALAVVPYVGAFVGMSTAMAVGFFPLLLTTTMLPFVTTPVWDALGRRVPDRWRQRVPDSPPGLLAKPPLERRALSWVRTRGYGRGADYALAYGRSFLTIAGLVVLLWILVYAASDVSGQDLPGELDNTHLEQQSWGLYAPDPSEAYSWYVVEAELTNGSTADALDGGSVSFDRPPNAAATYETFRHRKFMEKLRHSDVDSPTIIAEHYADWACDRANEVHDGEAERVTVYRMYQQSPVDGELEEPRKMPVVEQSCGV